METTPAAPKSRPVFGRAALAVAALAFLLTVLTYSHGFPTHATAAAARPVIAVLGVAGAVGLAIVSLRLGERRATAIVTLCLVVGSPALLMLVSMLVWFGYGLTV